MFHALTFSESESRAEASVPENEFRRRKVFIEDRRANNYGRVKNVALLNGELLNEVVKTGREGVHCRLYI